MGKLDLLSVLMLLMLLSVDAAAAPASVGEVAREGVWGGLAAPVGQVVAGAGKHIIGSDDDECAVKVGADIVAQTVASVPSAEAAGCVGQAPVQQSAPALSQRG